MKTFRLHLATLAFVLLLGATLHAQPKHSMAFRYTWYNYLTPLENLPGEDDDQFMDIYDQSNGAGLEIAYYNRLFTNTFLAVPLKLGGARTGRLLNGEFDNSRDVVGNLDVLLQHNFFATKAVSPYLHAGVGSAYNFDREVFDLNIPLGVGLNIRLNEYFYLSAQTQYRLAPAEDDLAERSGLDNWQHGAGIHLFFAPPKEEPLMNIAPPPPPDSDGDGIADANDRCPTAVGTAANGGCPDSDGDGIVDLDDACPTESGVAALRGCPDSDGDGIANNSDLCPNEPGTAAMRGCPDRDNDGVADKDDLCPDQRGAAALRGCPDRDNDGVADKDDQCPDTAGPLSNRGCPEITQEEQARLESITKNVQFNTGKATLLAASTSVLDEVAALMKKYPAYSLSIEGHTDSSGDDVANMRLSESRAKTCNDYLVGKGIDPRRISHKGFGETKPVADNKTEAGRKQNRRVEFKLTN